MLAELQQQLQERFAELAAQRRELKYPVYAIEHGFDELTLRNVKVAAHNYLRWSVPSSDHWLVWVMLAAEIGYTYSGDEFWGPFETEPGQWSSIERRRTLRSFYEKFGVLYGGPKPVGLWADHFNIISWPVANAILPLYLQRSFARHLYDLRYALAHRVANDGPGVGRFLLEEYEDGPSRRFRDFLQQTDLTTQIVFALRDEHLEGSVARIDPNTLARIVGDLERHSLERSYLRDTRKVLETSSIRFAPNLQAGGGVQSETTRPKQVPSRTLLVARRQSDGSFMLGFRLPDIMAILRAGGLNRNALNSARVRFAGRATRPEPASALESQSLKEWRLDTFPAPRVQLFQLEQAPTNARLLLDPPSRIEESRVWLLKRRTDGLYQEVLHAQIRAGHDYLLLSRSKLAEASVQAGALTPVSTSPAGVFAYHLGTSSLMTASQTVALGSLGIGFAGGVSISAAGINPAVARETGALPTWTSSEAVVLRLRADIRGTPLRVTLDGLTPETFNSGDGDVLLELGQLDPGRHEVAVSAISKDGCPASPEVFAFEIISPRPWPQAMRERAGFRLQLQPSNAALEQVTTGEAVIHVVGPSSRAVHWSIELYDTAGHFTNALRVGDTKVGVRADALQAMLDTAFRDHADKVDDSPRVDIVASLDELGRQAHSFDHPINPLRWKFDVTTGVIRLVDDTDNTNPAKIRVYQFNTPILFKEVQHEAAEKGLIVEPPGALFEAVSGEDRASIFASPRRTGALHGFSDLREGQSLSAAATNAATIIKLIDGLRHWKRARAVGQLALLRKQTTLRWIEHQIEIIACGEEFSSRLRHPEPNDLVPAQKGVGGSPGFGMRMRTFTERNLPAAAKQLTETAVHYQVDGAREWAFPATFLAFRPTKMKVPDGVDKIGYFQALLAQRTLLKGAFLARTASRRSHADEFIKETA
jgi:hypothetical protein